jgi:hypothetical protein
MLTEKHLAVVRAALKFLDEEMSPSGSEALFHYLDGRVADVSIENVKHARKLFDEFDLFYVLVDAAAVVVESERLIAASSNDELNFQADLSLIASVLVPAP